MLAHIHHRGQLSSGHPIRAVVEQQAGQIDIASAGVDEMIAPDGRTVPVTGQDNHRELRMGHFYPCGEREGTPVDGMHRVEVQITSSTAGAPYASHDHRLVLLQIQGQRRPQEGAQHRPYPTPWAPDVREAISVLVAIYLRSGFTRNQGTSQTTPHPYCILYVGRGTDASDNDDQPC